MQNAIYFFASSFAGEYVFFFKTGQCILNSFGMIAEVALFKKEQKKIPKQLCLGILGGELGIRTPGPVTVNSFQDCRNRPLCQFSN